MTADATALLLVDPYRAFLDDDGALWPLVSDVATRVGLRDNLPKLLSAARSSGVVVAYAPHRRWRPGDVDGWRRPGPVHQRLRDNRYYALGTPGGEYYPPVAPGPGELVAGEHWGMSGFAGTDLDQLLRQHGVTRLFLTGLTAPGCVEGTGRWAMELGYEVLLVSDAVAAFDEHYQHAATRLTGPLYAREVVSTEEALIAVASQARSS